VIDILACQELADVLTRAVDNGPPAVMLCPREIRPEHPHLGRAPCNGHLHLRFLRDTLERVIQPVGVSRKNEQAQAA
jgi:hypothetical protein